MKLTEDKISEIVENAAEYIWDNLWNEFDEIWVTDYLSAQEINDYDKEDVSKILEELKSCQKELQENSLSKERESLYQEIDELIVESEIHLDLVDIGKVLVRLANSYLNE